MLGLGGVSWLLLAIAAFVASILLERYAHEEEDGRVGGYFCKKMEIWQIGPILLHKTHLTKWSICITVLLPTGNLSVAEQQVAPNPELTEESVQKVWQVYDSVIISSGNTIPQEKISPQGGEV